MLSVQTVKPAIIRLAVLVACVSATACVDTATAPRTPAASRAFRDTVGDTTACKSGYSVMDGRYVCN